MYRILLIGGGLLTVTAACALTRLVWAQGQPEARPALATRIAVANIEAIFQNYKKAQIYKAASEKELHPLRKEAESLKKKIADRQAELRVANFGAAKRKQWEDAANAEMKKLQDTERDIAARNQKRIEKELVPIYREILEAIKAHARSNAIHVVLSYAEDPKIDPFSLASIARKVTGLEATGGVAALYVDPAADITAALTEVLNRRFNEPAENRVGNKEKP